MKPTRDFYRELIKEVKPCMSYKSGMDFDNWKIQAREKLSSLLKMEKFKKVDSEIEIEYQKDIEGATEIRFTFQTEKGYRVPAHLLIPHGVEKPPVMIALQGHSTGMHISLGRPKGPNDVKAIEERDGDFCIRAVKEGFATVALDQRNFGECAITNGRYCFEADLTALIMGRTTIGARVWDIKCLIDVLETEFNNLIDVNRICCMGNSGGGTATAYAAALEDRIILAMPSSALCSYKDSIGAHYHCSCNYVPDIANFFEMNDLIAMAFPKFYIQVNGVMDE